MLWPTLTRSLDTLRPTMNKGRRFPTVQNTTPECKSVQEMERTERHELMSTTNGNENPNKSRREDGLTSTPRQ